MKILFYEVRNFSPNFHWFENNIAKKLAQQLENFFLSKSISGYYKTKKKKKKKVEWTTKPLV